MTFATQASGAEQAKVTVVTIGHDLYRNFCLVNIEGTITPLTVKSFKKQINRRDIDKCEIYAPVVSIGASNGGDIQAAMEIAEIIIQKNLSTIIWPRPMSTANKYKEQRCLSACALIYASGKRRYFPDTMRNNILGIHKPGFLEKRHDTLQTEVDLDNVKYQFINMFQQNDIDPKFVVRMFETNFDEMYFPDIRELLIWGVITSYEKPPSFTQLQEN